MNNDTYYKLANHPLLFVLAEFRFAEIMGIEKYLSDIQEEIRNIFPLVNEQTVQEVNITPDGMEVKQTKQWAFIDKSKHNAVIINNKRLVFITSDYQRFDGFKKHCELSLEALIKVAKPIIFTRIGLRYADLITASNGEDITDYVKSNIYDQSHLNGVGSPVLQNNEAVLDTSEGSMVIRSMYGTTDISIFHDIGDMPINIATQNDPSERILLDFDHFCQLDIDSNNNKNDDASLNSEKNNIIGKLEKMHELSRKAFWNITTERGREVWK